MDEFQKLNESYYEAIDKIKERYYVDYTIKEEDLEKYAGSKVGEVVRLNPPIPNDPVEAFELFKNRYAAVYFEIEKLLFIEKYQFKNEASILAELKILSEWIEHANKEEYNPKSGYSNELEFLKLTNGYYNGHLMTYQQLSDNGGSALIYARYVLFYEWLQLELIETRKDKFFRIDTDYALKANGTESKPRYGTLPKIQVNLSYTVDGAKVPVLNLAIWNLLQKKVPLQDGTYINGEQFLESYLLGFKNGCNYFKDEYGSASRIDIIKYGEAYYEDLRKALFECDPLTGSKSKPWRWYFESSLFQVSKSMMETYGYYTGLCWSADELIKKHPTVFKDFPEPKGNPESDIDSELEIDSDIEKLVMLQLTGVLNDLRSRYPEFIRSPIKLTTLLASIIGVDKNSNRWRTLSANVNHLNGATPERVLMKKHVKKIKAELIKLGIEVK